MKTTQDGIDLIKHYEGFQTTPYVCAGGRWTIGYGATYDIDGKAITEHSAPIDEATATAWLIDHIASLEKQVERLLKAPLNGNQLSAVVSLVYNIGLNNFRRSDTLSALNAGDHDRMAKEWREWRKAGGTVLQGLVKRREAELQLFFAERNIP